MKEKVKALIIKPDGTTLLTEIKQDVYTLQEIVEGNIEYVSLKYGHLYCNEDGYALDLKANPRANAIARKAGWIPIPGDYLKGTIVFLGQNYDEGSEEDVPEEILALWV
jgi:hypothetical protein